MGEVLNELAVPMEWRAEIFTEVENELPGFRAATLKLTDLEMKEVDKVLK